MQDMLKKIIAVDKKAKQTVEEAKTEKENVEKKLYEAKKSIESEYEKKAQESIEAMKENKRREFEVQEKAIKDGFDEKKAVLEEKFISQADKWAEETARRAIEI